MGLVHGFGFFVFGEGAWEKGFGDVVNKFNKDEKFAFFQRG